MYSRFFSHSPACAQLPHIWLISVHFFLVFLVFSVYPTNACSRYSYWWWWRVPSLLPPLLPIKLPLASTRTKRDFGRCRLCPPGFGENHPGERKTKRKRKKKALPKRKGKGKGKPETRKRIRSIIRSTKEREREREKRSPSKEREDTSAERARSRFNCRFCNYTISRTNPSVAFGTSQTRESARASFREII